MRTGIAFPVRFVPENTTVIRQAFCNRDELAEQVPASSVWAMRLIFAEATITITIKAVVVQPYSQFSAATRECA
jgi:hypothetical protein